MLGQSGFPYGMAAMSKLKLISEGLVYNGNRLTFFNRLPVLPNIEPYTSLAPKGSIKGVNYIYTTGKVIRPSGFTRRNIIRFQSYFQEFTHLIKENRNHKINIAFIHDDKIRRVVYYFILSRIFRFKLVMHYVEFRSMIPGKKMNDWINNWLFDKYVFYFLDAILPISYYLESYTRKTRPEIPQFKLPVIVDFTPFNSIEKKSEDFLLFCGSAGYFNVISFIIDAFENIVDNKIRLVLIINGFKQDMEKVKNRILRSPRQHNIEVKSGITFESLLTLYCSAKALLIPLRDSVQDHARFPHKIGEYCAAKKPIITTNYGEIPLYFKQGFNAQICSSFDPIDFTNAINEVLNDPVYANNLGINAYITGFEHFEYISVTSSLNKFLNSLLTII